MSKVDYKEWDSPTEKHLSLISSIIAKGLNTYVSEIFHFFLSFFWFTILYLFFVIIEYVLFNVKKIIQSIL